MIALKQRWEALLSDQPDLRIRNAAEALGVSEAELLATRTGEGVTLLRPEFKAIMGKLQGLGRVMALTRNADVVHERKGTYLNASLDKGPVGLFVGADIDLRIFWNAWAFAFAVEEPGRDGVRHSLQFFGRDGEAIHKVYLLPESDHQAYHGLVMEFAADEQQPHLLAEAPPAATPERPDASIDVPAFQQAWLELKDTHDFHMLLHRFGVSRTQALRLAPAGHATLVQHDAPRRIIQQVAAQQVPIMIFVANRGMLQIHTGVVCKLMDIPGWFNVVDPDFNLHLREAAIAQCWVVRKPTSDGMVTALECYNDKGEQLVQFFGKRKPGVPELESWRTLVADLDTAVQHA